MIGRVVSTKMQKTATVLVESRKTHPLYKKSFKMSKKYLADDQIGVKPGDIVEIKKIRPVSKRKHWKIVKVIGKSMAEVISEKLKEEAEEVIEEVMPEVKEQLSINNQELSEEKIIKKRKGGKQIEVVVDDLADKAK